jgi:anaerobic magnesium-protoporphyrin IX monomethyl ester cyclase
MKICLIRCPSPFLIEDKLFPPLGLMAVGTCLKRHDVTIYDEDGIPRGYDAYGFGPTTPEYGYALEVKELLFDLEPRAKFVIGGPYATLQPKKCVDDGWDCTVVGDGEFVSDLAFTGNQSVIVANEEPIDEHPIIDRSLIDIKSYKYYLDDRLATTLTTGKGCPFKCAFCCKNHCSVRLRSAENIIKEIDYLHNDFGYDALAFPEDLFILDRKRAETVFKHMKKRGIISRCLVRADIVARYGPEFAEMMVDCGCTHIGMGVESGSDTILKNVNKGESVKIIKYAIEILKNAGIRVKGFFIVGLPGESHETINETRSFLDEMKLFDIDCKIFQPYPGSPIWDHKEDYDIDWDDIPLSDMFYKGRAGEYYGTIRTSALTTDEIRKEWIDMEANYKCLN